MSQRFRTASLKIALFSLLVPHVAALAATEAPSDWIFLPDTEHEQAMQLDGATWTSGTDVYRMRLTRIDDDARQSYLERVIGFRTDPFAAPETAQETYVSFLFELENIGDQVLVYNPLKTWLITNKKEIQSPLGVPDLSFAYRVSGREFPTAYERVAKALLFDSREVAAGRMLHGLLVFRNVKAGTKRVQIDVQLSLGNGDHLTVTAPYKRPKPDKKKRKKQS
ncbi:MAG: hypothetical protein GY716_00240 [bacterium]|nr:hypothetical protein [bacterium]